MACLYRVGSSWAFGWGLLGLSGGVFLGLGVGFLLFHRFFLDCFALVSIDLRGFLESVFVPGCVCFEPLGSSFVSRAFFFASLLLCFSSALLLSVNRFFTPVCGVIQLFYILP